VTELEKIYRQAYPELFVDLQAGMSFDYCIERLMEMNNNQAMEIAGLKDMVNFLSQTVSRLEIKLPK